MSSNKILVTQLVHCHERCGVSYLRAAITLVILSKSSDRIWQVPCTATFVGKVMPRCGAE